MSLDTTAPRTRRAIIAGAFGVLLGTIGVSARPPAVRAGTDGDVVLDATNTAAGTTVINGNGSNPVFRVANADEDGVQAISANGVGLLGGSGDTSFPGPIETSTGVYGISVDGHGVYGASDSNAAVYGATNAATVAAVVGEGADFGIGVHGEADGGGSVGVLGNADIGVRGIGSIAAPAPVVPFGTGVHGHGGVGVYGSTQTGTGVFGKSGNVAVPFGNVDRAVTGVYGFCGHDANASGVVGETTVGVGTYGIATTGVGVRGLTTSGIAVKADTTSGIAVKAATSSGTAVDADSQVGNGIRASAGLDGVIGESHGDKSGVVGFSGPTQAPAGPANTGVYGEASQDSTARGVFGKSTTGQGVRGEASQGVGVAGEAPDGTGVEGRGGTGVVGVAGSSAIPNLPTAAGVQGFGTIGVYGSSTASVGLFGKSGAGSPAVPAKTGMYGFAAQDSLAQGVFGESTAGAGALGRATTGHGVRGEATTGIGVRAEATTGLALDVSGRAMFSRSGRASLPAGAKFVDVTVPGGLSANANVLATLQIKRAKVHVVAARPNQPSAGKVRIYVSDVASATEATPIAWFVLG